MQVDPFHLEADTIDYHADQQHRRVERALAQITIGDLLARVDDLLAAEPDPQAHPLAGLAAWHLEKRVTALSGAELFDRCNALVRRALDGCLDDILEALDEEV